MLKNSRYGGEDKKMKKKWTNNIGLKIMSVALAFVLWILIVNIEDPSITRTFRVPVDILNENVVESSGRVYTILEGKEVDVTVKGNKSFVDSLKDSDIKATADLKYISFTGSVNIVAECTKYTNTAYSLTLSKEKSILVELEDVAEERYPVQFNIIGRVPEGYYVSTALMKSSPGMITVRDGETVINKITSIVVDVNVSKRTGAFIVSAVPKAYNSDGEVIVSPNMQFSMNEVEVNVSVLPTKTVPVKVTLEGEPAYGYQVLETIFEPNQVLIAGTEKDLEKYNSIEIKVPIKDAKATIEEVVKLQEDILPANIIVADKNTTVAVEVKIDPLTSKEITFTSTDISVKLPPNMVTYNFENPTATYKVKVLATKDVADQLTIESIKPTIDLTNKTYGTHEIKLQFNPDYTIEVIGEDIVTVVIGDPNTSTPTPTVEPSATPTDAPNSTETDPPSEAE